MTYLSFTLISINLCPGAKCVSFLANKVTVNINCVAETVGGKGSKKKTELFYDTTTSAM
jgi:hypothetical protein